MHLKGEFWLKLIYSCVPRVHIVQLPDIFSYLYESLMMVGFML